MPRRTSKGPTGTPPTEGSLLIVERELVARRAYEIWEAEGRPEGLAELHWQRAEEELLKRGAQPKRVD